VREGMEKYGGHSAKAFKKFMDDEPGLLVPLIQSFGIPCKSAEIMNVKKHEVLIRAVPPQKNTAYAVILHFTNEAMTLS